jgi:hypothetical protein
MALYKCPECAKEVSGDLKYCLHCGKQLKTSFALKALLVLIGLGMLGSGARHLSEAINGTPEEVEAARIAAMSPADREAHNAALAKAAAVKKANDALESAAFGLVKSIRAGAKDEDSVKFIKLYASAQGVVCVEYSAKNSFGARVKEFGVLKNNKYHGERSSSSAVKIWNESCVKGQTLDLIWLAG